MDKIVKQISLEQFKTRFPVTYPSLKDGKIVYVDSNVLAVSPNANYGLIPLGVNENICGSYSTFTSEMWGEYKNKTLDYKTLESWFLEFKNYYNIINSSSCSAYKSAVEYYNAITEHSGTEISSFEELDALHKKRGGDKFYQWLSTHYFISLNFKAIYNEAKSNGCSLTISYGEWLECISNLNTDIMYYPDVLEFLGNMKRWMTLYGDDCSIYDDCCECVKYKKYGGINMILVLEYWCNKTQGIVDEINTKIKSLTEVQLKTITPKCNLKLSFKRKVEDLGDYTIFCKEFNPAEPYQYGDVCIYENEVYYMKSPSGDGRKAGTYEYEFNPANWQTYLSLYKSNNASEFKDYPHNKILSGKTVSSLDSFVWSVETVDNVGNVLDGHFVPYSGSTFTQPAEGAWIDLPYEIGKAVNISLSGDGKYTGDVLISAKTYAKDNSGNTLSGTVITINEGESIINAVEHLLENISTNDIVTDGQIYVDFEYWKNTLFTYNNATKKVQLCDTDIFYNNGYHYGVQCIETCTLLSMTGAYYLSETDYYPINYYKVVRDAEEKENSYSSEPILVNMCTWYLRPAIYNTNEMVAAPMIRREELLGFSGPEKVDGNIYIDRGYATVLDQHLRLGDVVTFEALEKYGNGSFNIINSQEQLI